MSGLFGTDLIEFWQMTGDPFIVGSKQPRANGSTVEVVGYPLRVMREVSYEQFQFRYAELPPEYSHVLNSRWPHFYEVATD